MGRWVGINLLSSFDSRGSWDSVLSLLESGMKRSTFLAYEGGCS